MEAEHDEIITELVRRVDAQEITLEELSDIIDDILEEDKKTSELITGLTKRFEEEKTERKQQMQGISTDIKELKENSKGTKSDTKEILEIVLGTRKEERMGWQDVLKVVLTSSVFIGLIQFILNLISN